MRKRILPKIWLQYIQRFWEKKVPTGYPATSSEFSLDFGDNSAAVSSMIENLNSEDSIITDEMLSENTSFGGCLGVYDVEGTPGEETLISPEKIPAYAIDVIAMHYDAESEEWEKIDDVVIKDRYAYATLESFSPIALFYSVRATFLAEDVYVGNSKVNAFVCNGVPCKFYMEDDKLMAEDAYGNKSEVPSGYSIIGGTIDGSSIEKASVVCQGITGAAVYAGSCFKPDEGDNRVAAVKKATLVIEDCTFSGIISGACPNSSIADIDITVKNSSSSSFGLGNSMQNRKNQNPDPVTNSTAKTRVDNAKIRVDGLKCTGTNSVIYAGSNNGTVYVGSVDAEFKNCKATYMAACSSNGRDGKMKVYLENCEVSKEMGTSVRCIVENSDVTIKDCTFNEFFAVGNNADKGSVLSQKLDILSGSYTLSVGSNNNTPFTNESLKAVMKPYIKIGRDVKITFAEGAKEVYKDLIVRK